VSNRLVMSCDVCGNEIPPGSFVLQTFARLRNVGSLIEAQSNCDLCTPCARRIVVDGAVNLEGLLDEIQRRVAKVALLEEEPPLAPREPGSSFSYKSK
jgi:hypothetical protein